MHVAHFKAIESVKSAQRGNKMGKKIDPGRSRLGKKIGRLEVYTPPCGTGGPSCHGNEDHLSIHDELGQPHAWQERLPHRQDWWRGGVLGLAFWILGERRLPN